MTSTPLPPSPLLGQALPVELMNTIWADQHGIHDSLASIGDARRWVGALSSRLDAPAHDSADTLDDAQRARLRDLRDAMRRIAAEQTEDPRERAASAMTDLRTAVTTVNEAARLAPTWPALELTEDDAIVERSHTAGATGDVLVSTLATEAIDLFGQRNDLDLRACLAPRCVLYFIKDQPRREWCSVGCGNRARAARHYARHGRARTAE